MNLLDIEMVHIPTGTFFLGATENDRYANPHENPKSLQQVSAFYLSKYPITEKQFGMGETDLPAVKISWHEAKQFCHNLTSETDQSVTLPTEEQWEYACRAGSDTPFPHSDFISIEEANFLYDDLGNKIGIGQRSPVGKYPENAFGLNDMLGNVAVWTESEWKRDYHPNSKISKDRKVIRGAGWDTLPRLLRCSNRDFAAPETARDNLGFRILVAIHS